MSATPASTFSSLEQLVADLQRQLAEREADYDAAFVIDPDGHRLEAVFQQKNVPGETLIRQIRSSGRERREGWVMSAEFTIRPFTEQDSIQVREIFVAVNRLLSPPDRRAAFEAYIERSLSEEIDCISDYYSERDGGFWVAVRSDKVIGFFGLERVSGDAMELRRMYVDPSARRQGIARRMLQFAENQARCRKASRLELSTSELQDAALALHRAEKYTLVREENVDTPSNKTIGSGIRRYYFEKALG